MTHDVDINIEVVLTARLVYRGVTVEVKTEPTGDYESAEAKLLKLMHDTKRAIDYAAEKAEADREAGIREPDGDPASDRREYLHKR